MKIYTKFKIEDNKYETRRYEGYFEVGTNLLKELARRSATISLQSEARKFDAGGREFRSGSLEIDDKILHYNFEEVTDG